MNDYDAVVFRRGYNAGYWNEPRSSSVYDPVKQKRERVLWTKGWNAGALDRSKADDKEHSGPIIDKAEDLITAQKGCDSCEDGAGIPTATTAVPLTPNLTGITVSDNLLTVRQFVSGATRDQDSNKPDYEGFFSPLVLAAYADYMHRHRKQSDGQLRASDNWQKGMPKDEYIKSLFRHFMDLWLIHDGFKGRARESLEDALCGILFNTMGYMFEDFREQNATFPY